MAKKRTMEMETAMSDTPIYDTMRAMQQAATQAGYIEGRISMRWEVLAILRSATKHMPPAMSAAISKIENLPLTKGK